jgi:pimeloyl-ACP methyl ester carboxylesterase
MAESAEELLRRKRRKRLVQGLLVGAAAIGVPALANAFIRKRAGKLTPPRWGRAQRYSWVEGELTFQRLGSGPPIVLLHSFGPGHDGEQWREAAILLAERYRVYVPDLLGWGRSAKPDLTYDGELYVQLLDDFLHDVVSDRAVVVAAGLPAAYTVQLAVDIPERVRAIALVVPEGLGVHSEEPDLKDALVHRLLRVPVLGTSALNVYTSRKGLTHHLEQEVYATPERADADLVEHHYVAAHQPGAHAALAAYLSGYLNHNVRELLPRLAVPTWLAWGREAVNPPVATADLWLHGLDAELSIFELCGSHPHFEQPRAFSRGLLSFLADLRI